MSPAIGQEGSIVNTDRSARESVTFACPGDVDPHRLSAQDIQLDVVADGQARYFGALLGERTLVPGDGARSRDASTRSSTPGPTIVCSESGRLRVSALNTIDTEHHDKE